LILAYSGLPSLMPRRREGMPRALADNMPLVLRSGGEHAERQPVRPRHVSNGEIEPPCYQSAWR
jgi:hypothetical protein